MEQNTTDGGDSSLVNSKQSPSTIGSAQFEARKLYRGHDSGKAITALEDNFRHNGWAERRLRVYRALHDLHRSEKVLSRFAHCGAQTSIESSKEGLRLLCDHCRNRCCQPCGSARAAIIRACLLPLMENREVRFVTLTLRHSKTPLEDQLDRLYRSFNVLRRRKFWLSHVDGGAGFCEVKVSDKDGLWHPHLHLVVVGDFMDQKTLSQEWLAVTGDSSIVDISKVRETKTVGFYITKYVSKPLDSSLFADESLLQEAIVALSGRRLCMTFGSWRGTPLVEVESSETSWSRLGTTAELLEGLAINWPESVATVARILQVKPEWAPLFGIVTVLGRQLPGP